MSVSTNEVIEAVELVARYGSKTILDGVSLRVGTRETLVVLGPSGCGKSTLMRTLVGLNAPAAGEVRLFGRALHDLEESERSELLRQVK